MEKQHLTKIISYLFYLRDISKHIYVSEKQSFRYSSHGLRGNSCRDALHPVTQSVTNHIPTQSMGTMLSSIICLKGIMYFMFTVTSLKAEERMTQAIFTGKRIISTRFHNDFNPTKNFTRLNLPLFVTDRNIPKVLTLFRAHFGTPDQDADFAGNGSVKLADLNIVHSLFKLVPGSSGLSPPRA